MSEPQQPSGGSLGWYPARLIGTAAALIIVGVVLYLMSDRPRQTRPEPEPEPPAESPIEGTGTGSGGPAESTTP